LPENERKLTGPWRKVHGAIWLIGLAILAWKGWWWPGILVLVAFSMVAEAVILQYAPQTRFNEKDNIPAAIKDHGSAESHPPHQKGVLPAYCPKCGAPTLTSSIRWIGDGLAECLFCGVHISSERK
jgi:hypothetical protein